MSSFCVLDSCSKRNRQPHDPRFSLARSNSDGIFRHAEAAEAAAAADAAGVLPLLLLHPLRRPHCKISTLHDVLSYVSLLGSLVDSD